MNLVRRPQIFLSYSHKDELLLEQLKEADLRRMMNTNNIRIVDVLAVK